MTTISPSLVACRTRTWCRPGSARARAHRRCAVVEERIAASRAASVEVARRSCAPIARISSRDAETSWSPFSALVLGVRMGSGEPLVLLEPVGQLVAAEDALARGVVRPDARRGDAGDVRAHDHLDRERRALGARARWDRARAARGSASRGRSCSNHHAASAIQNLALEGKRAEHAIERADAIGDDDEAPSVCRCCSCRGPCLRISRRARRGAFRRAFGRARPAAVRR